MIGKATFLALFFVASVSFAGAAPPAGAPRPRVALVLSGGSALGLAHVGVIRELEKAGIPIDMVLGTSMGSLVGGLYAAGYSPDRLDAFATGLDWNSIFTERRETPGDRYDHLKRERFPFALGFDRRGPHLGQGLLEGQNVLSLLTSMTLHVLAVRDFDELPVPFRAVAADILTGEKVVFSAGSIAEAMRCSMSIPGLFRPYEAQGHLLVDGGIADNMPVDEARAMGADIVIAVESRGHIATSAGQLKSAIAISNQAMGLFIEENMRPSRAGADLLIRPDLSGYTTASYSDAAALIKRGEDAAQAMSGEIAALASRIASSRKLALPEEQANRRAMREAPVLGRLEVEAPSPADEAIVRAAFAPLLGKRLDPAAVRAAIDRTYGTGAYDLVTLDLEPGPSGTDEAVGVVRMRPIAPARNELLLGLGFRGLYSAFSSNEVTIQPALYLGEPSGPDSAFFVEAGMGARTRAYAEYFQPIGRAFLLPYLKYESTYDSYPIGEGLGLRAYYRSAGGGAWLGWGLGRGADVEAGWSYESIRSSDVSDPAAASGSGPTALSNSETGSVNLAFRADDRPVLVFPERGAWVMAKARWANPAFLGDTSFISARIELGGALPLAKRWTLGCSLAAASDFSGFVPGAAPIPADRRFSLRGPGMFYGLEPRPERESGDHAAGAGLELRASVGRINPILGGELYAIANLSAGSARVEGDPDNDFLPIRWNPSLGMGARFGRAFGALVAVGLVADGNPIAPIRPALSLELGSLSSFLEDLR
jgi:NTE family protein